MCGIVGAIAQRDVTPILIEGLRRLEYRGYDSAGVAVIGEHGLTQRRSVGKVAELAARIEAEPAEGRAGIAHTRWATHGGVTEANAHPHVSRGRLAVVHNGIIENHEPLRESVRGQGYAIDSETDTEVIAHLVHAALDQHETLLDAVRSVIAELRGAYGLAVADAEAPDALVVARAGSPLVIGVGIGEHFVASDVAALLPVTQRFIYLEEGDVAEVRRNGVRIVDAAGQPVERPVHETALQAEAAEKGNYRHYMAKEIFEQPRALTDTLQGLSLIHI